MDQISQHIAYLLLTCRNVSIEGLGTFRAKFQSASFNADLHIFYPSKIKIEFYPKIEKSAMSLEASLQRKLKLKENKAREMVEQYVSKILLRLKKSRYCRLEGLGYLFFDYKGNLSIKDTFWKKYNPSPLMAEKVV